jgi:predicted HicB family RNase H-like nuclease
MLSARVDADLRQAVKRHAVEHGISVQQLVTDAVTAYLTQQGTQ